MIEVVISLAITAIMIVAVAQCTQALTHAATRRSKASASLRRWSTLHDLLQNDIRGWMPVKTTVEPTSGDVVLIAFCSTADYHCLIAMDKETVRCRSTQTIQYVSRRANNGRVLVRIAKLDEDNIFELPILTTTGVPEVSFYDGKTWNATHTEPGRPLAVLFKVDDRELLLRP
jgi:hypothetical protein